MLKRTTKIAFLSSFVALSAFSVSAEDMQFGVTPPQITAQTYV